MIAIKRRCKFFDTCQLADPTSVTCMNGGGDYCGAFRELKRKENE
jgi:hypothetical protein